MEELNNPEDWNTSELFNYCKNLYIIEPDSEFEDWKNNRIDLLQFVKDDIMNN